ncbi:TetR/AcrR family transcriptional regulator [Gordonia zhaorongruii]|uniref:TetR/AcrR family transcriptional regulator n=1 Tax=Gordonia zhaorongruii TaxID=2597659 RepID=UPI001180C38D|nr:TetR/AcrR family transcriptional regulator [Gordonia zhaorongruii]
MPAEKPRARTSAADIRTSLVAAGRRIVERDGASALTVRAVATEAGVAPMGVYNHFAGKDGLISAVATDGFAAFGDAIAQTDADAVDRLRNSGMAYRRFALANPAMYGLMFDGHSAPDPLVAENAFSVITDIIRYGQVAGVIRSGDAQALASHTWAAVHGAVSLEITAPRPSDADPAEIYDGLLDMVARGLAA